MASGTEILSRSSTSYAARCTHWLLLRCVGIGLVASSLVNPLLGQEALVTKAQASSEVDPIAEWVSIHCLDCHTSSDPAGDFSLEDFSAEQLGGRLPAGEKMIRRIRTRQMPPPDADRPTETEYEAFLALLEPKIAEIVNREQRWTPAPALRRLTRTEYQNSVRDLLGVTFDASTILPADSVSHGFDNITVTDLSPTRMERYLTTAELVARLAVGSQPLELDGSAIRIPPDRSQTERLDGLPVGTRGGVRIVRQFPRSGEYSLSVRLMRDRNEEVEGLFGKQSLLFYMDGELVTDWQLNRPKSAREHATADEHLQVKVDIPAGQRELALTFREQSNPLLETRRQPYDAQFNMHRHPRQSPAIYEVSIVGPYQDAGVASTKSRQKVLGKWGDPNVAMIPAEVEIKERIEGLALHAYRRPPSQRDLEQLQVFFDQGNSEGGLELGFERVVSAILVNPRFLYRIESNGNSFRHGDGSTRMLDDFELASRLAFFLWSSIPDEDLLELAEQGRLSEPLILSQQVERMLRDERSESLSTNFASQWLYLRNLDSIRPNLRLFPDFDDNLRQAMRRETELFFDWVVREDRSILELIKSNQTFLNERLARHYDLPHVVGSQFRPVTLDGKTERGGLLRQASILTVTSYATRTSPVIRGNWVLENIIGTPPPPPPADVPSLDAQGSLAGLGIRERLKRHREDASCATCHRLMDPVGFSLENFDAVGKWRDLEGEQRISAEGGLPDGAEFEGVSGLEAAILQRPEQFATTLTEKLLTYALGRGIEPTDGSFVREIVQNAEASDYQFSAIILGIVQSDLFRKRKAEIK